MKKVLVSFLTTVQFDGVGPHLYKPYNGAIYLAPGFKAGDRVRVTVTKISSQPRKPRSRR